MNSEVRERRIDLAEFARREHVAAPYERRRAWMVSGETERLDTAVEDEVENRLEDEVTGCVESWLHRQILVGIAPIERAVVERVIEDLRGGN